MTGYGAVIAGFPEQIHPGGIGQLCNDATTSTEEDERKKYGDKYNVTDGRDIDGCFVIVATRKIRKGEQLFYDYGIEYWQGKQERLKKLGSLTAKQQTEMWLTSKLEDILPTELWTELMRVMKESYEGENDPNDPLLPYKKRCYIVQLVRALLAP